jgi:hypothetical protein
LGLFANKTSHRLITATDKTLEKVFALFANTRRLHLFYRDITYHAMEIIPLNCFECKLIKYFMLIKHLKPVTFDATDGREKERVKKWANE